MKIQKTINGAPFTFYVKLIPNSMKALVRKFHGDEWVECEISDDLKWINLPPGKFIVDTVEVLKLKINNRLKDDVMFYNNIEEPVLKNSSQASNETYNSDELRHIAVNFAITCLKGYEGSFDEWFNKITSNWREIANRGNKK